jgi:hypothetical protein
MDKGRFRVLLALIAGIIFMALNAMFPDLPFTEEQNLAFFGLLAAYMVGEGLEGKRIADNFKAMLSSWKFRSLLAGVSVLTIKAFWVDFPLTEEQVIGAIEIFSALIIGAGAEGALTKLGALAKQ